MTESEAPKNATGPQDATEENAFSEDTTFEEHLTESEAAVRHPALAHPEDEDSSDEPLPRGLTREELEAEFQRRGETFIQTGDAKGEDGDFKGALGEYKRAARLDPTSPERLLKLAEGYAANDLTGKALEAFGRALEASQETGVEAPPDAYVGLGDLCRTVANSAAAIRSYERAVRARPKKPFYRWKLAVALAALGLYDQAETQLRRAVELVPEDTFYNFYLADILSLMGRQDEATAQFARVVELAPRDEYYRLRWGAALLRVGQTVDAVEQFQRVANTRPENDAYRALLRYALIRDGQDPPIALDVEMAGLGDYDRDFVRRIQALCVAA